MIIEENDFKITSIDDSSPFFDLELLYTVNKGKAKERIEFRNAGYGLTLDNALKKIIMYRINNRRECLSLKEFIKEWKIESEKLRNVIQEDVVF